MLTFRYEAVTRATSPPVFQGGAFASRRPAEARCNERSHTPGCGRVSLRDFDSDPCHSSDASLCAGLKPTVSRSFTIRQNDSENYRILCDILYVFLPANEV